jgi:hypothetical protein
MSNDPGSILNEIRRSIEKNVKQQIERHREVTPNVELPKIIDIQIQQEKEKIEGLLEREEDPKMANVLQALLDYLPIFAKQLKSH